MSLKVMSIVSRRYLQGAALLVVTGLVAGCSSGTQRFTDSFYTGATPNQQQAMNQQPVYQQMPPATGAVQSSELPPAASQPAQQTQVASAGQALGTPPQNLGTLTTSSGTTTTGKSSSYIVQSGDTLYSVSRKTGADVNAIKSANGLTNGGIRVGQSLIIPGGHAAVASNAGSTTHAATTLQPPTTVAAVKTTTPATPAVVQTETPKTVETTAPKAATSEPAVATGSTTTMQQAENVAVVAPQATGISKMRWPAQGRILSSFGQKEGTSTNDGVDIMVPEGTSVKAAENGVVIYAGDGLKEFGNTVLIRHENNIVTVYGHNSKILVQRGQKVRRGDEIAKSGMSGNASSPRVHFEVRKNSSPVNPVKYLEN